MTGARSRLGTPLRRRNRSGDGDTAARKLREAKGSKGHVRMLWARGRVSLRALRVGMVKR